MRVRVVTAFLISFALLATNAYAATPTPKASAKSSAKPVASKSATTEQATASSSKKPSKKPVKKKVKKTATPIPSPSPVWPPVKFTSNKGIYAKIPTSKELLGLVSAKAGLRELVKKCESFACGAVIVAAEYRCEWWEIKSTVYGPDPSDANKKIALGKLRTLYGSLSPKTYANIILISEEPLAGPTTTDPATGQVVLGSPRTGVIVGGISAICHKSGTNEKIPANIYTRIN
ncbi:MAG: hypothetical protein FJW82_01930 [Actinobacteria bacterium]|nr:hypothetical protein [Actinomycetota bacterium]